MDIIAIKGRRQIGEPSLLSSGAEALTLRSHVDCQTFRPAGTIHHGSWVRPELMGPYLKPHQARELLSGKLIDHGPEPAVCCAVDLVSPAVQSLLGRSPMWAHRDDRTTIPFVQLMIPATDGTDYFFTPAAAIKYLARHHTHGYIYSITPIPESAEDFADPIAPGPVREVRIPERVRWSYAGRTSVTDLPDTLLVVDGPSDCLSRLRDASRPVPHMADPLTFCQAHGVLMRRFSDVRGQLYAGAGARSRQSAARQASKGRSYAADSHREGR